MAARRRRAAERVAEERPWIKKLLAPTVVREVFRLLRWIVVAVTACYLTSTIAATVERVAGAASVWLQLVGYVGSILSAVLMFVWKYRKVMVDFGRVNRARQERIVALEQAADPGRSSSGVNPDGTSEMDA